MAVKKAATRRAAPKPAVVRNPLDNNASEIMKKHKLLHIGGRFEENLNEYSIEPFVFYESVDEMPGTCAVRVISDFADDDSLLSLPLTKAEQYELFKFAITETLTREGRNQLVASTVHYQTIIAGFLEAAGFKNAGTSENPSSGNEVTVWVLSI